jgi:hypothetical protein
MRKLNRPWLRRRAHLPVDVPEQRVAGRPRRVAAGEQRERLVEPAPVEVRVEVAEARRQAAAHLPVGRRVLAPVHLAPAVAQAEERVELLLELGRRRPAAQRADVHRVPRRGLRRHLEHRVGDVEAHPQVRVRILVLELDVARRA